MMKTKRRFNSMAINKKRCAARFNRPVQPLVPFVSGSAAEILGPAGARRDLETVGPAEETRMQRRHRREVHRGHRLTAQQRLVRTASPETGAPLLLPLELRYALRPLQRVRPERPLREEVLQMRKDDLKSRARDLAHGPQLASISLEKCIACINLVFSMKERS